MFYLPTIRLHSCKITLKSIDPMGARRNFSRGGQSHRHFKKSIRFRCAEHKIDHFSARRRSKRKFLRFLFSRRLRLKYRVSSASAEGASDNFRVFCRTAAYDVIFSNSREGQVPPLPPLRAPMHCISVKYEGVSNKFCLRVFSRCVPQVLPPGV